MKKELKFPLKGKYVAMLAPSFVVDFSYPEIIGILKKLGFSKVVELTFGAKIVNAEYHKILKNSSELKISSVCPGVVETIKNRFPEYYKNLIKVDSPMIVCSKICRKNFPKHKIVFISPCNFKKIEAQKSKYVDYVIDFRQLKKIIEENNIFSTEKFTFDNFFENSTKIYPLAGGLSKTAHIKNIIDKNEYKILDGIEDVIKFLKSGKNIKFLDATFCKGGCIGGDCINSKLPILFRKRKVLNYMKNSRKEKILNYKLGKIKKAEGINFLKK